MVIPSLSWGSEKLSNLTNTPQLTSGKDRIYVRFDSKVCAGKFFSCVKVKLLPFFWQNASNELYGVEGPALDQKLFSLWLWHWLAVWPWASHTPSLGFTFFIYKVIRWTKKKSFQNCQAVTLTEESKTKSWRMARGLESRSPPNRISRNQRPSSGPTSPGTEQPHDHPHKSFQS